MNDHAEPNTRKPAIPGVALILGITGAIGWAIAARLAARGFAIRALSRNPGQGLAFGYPVEWIKGDAANRADVMNAAKGATVLVHGVNPPGYRKWRELGIPMLANSIEAAAVHGATILFPANVYVFSPQSGSFLDEGAARDPQTRKGKIRLEMEQMLEDAAAARGVRTIALRAGDFFGPGVPNSWFAQAVAKGGMDAKVVQDPSSPGIGHSWAYVPDLAEAFARLVDRRETLRAYEMLHFGGHWMDPGRALCEAAQAEIARPGVRIRSFSWSTVYLGAPFVPFLREVIEMRWLWRHPLRLDNARLESIIGPEPHTPLPDAVRATLRDMNVMGRSRRDDAARPDITTRFEPKKGFSMISTSPMREASLPGSGQADPSVPLAVLAALQTVLFLVPMIVLGQAIGWPASLRLPAAEALPLIAQEALAVQIGYWAYLLTSLAFVPFALAMRRFAVARGEDGLVTDTMAGLGIAVAIFKMLGIVRWLVVMPTLAALYTSSPDPAQRAAIELSYVVLNGYAGAAGELLGVQLVSGLWLVLAGTILHRVNMRWMGLFASVTGALFVATCLRTVLPQVAMLQSVAVPLALVWFLAFAGVLWARHRNDVREASAGRPLADAW